LSPTDSPRPTSSGKTARAIGIEGLEGNLVEDGNGWFVNKSRFSLFKNSEAGTFYFNMKFSGVLRKRAFWIANYQDEKNYVQFEIDERTITMSVIADGKSTTSKSVPHPLVKNDNYYPVSIQVDPNRVVFGGLQNGRYNQFYTWTSQSGNLLERRFGFRGEVDLSAFRFLAAQ